MSDNTDCSLKLIYVHGLYIKHIDTNYAYSINVYTHQLTHSYTLMHTHASKYAYVHLTCTLEALSARALELRGLPMEMEF